MSMLGRPTKARWYHPSPLKLVIAAVLANGGLWWAAHASWLGLRTGSYENVQLAAALSGLLLLLWAAAAVLFRRRLQFGVGGMLALTVLAALPCRWYTAWTAHRDRQREALAAVCLVQQRICEGGKHRRWIAGDPKERLVVLAGEPPKVVRLSFAVQESIGCDCCFDDIASTVSDDDLRHVASLHGLEHLALPRSKITDAGLRHLRGLRELRTLDLSQNRVTDAGLAHLRWMPELERLSLVGAEITDKGLAQIGRLESLKSLDLTGTKITDAGFEHLARLRNLESLRFEETAVTGEGIRHLAGCSKLTEFRPPPLSAAGASLCSLLPGVQRLQLRISDPPAGPRTPVVELRDMPSLTHLTVSCSPGAPTLRLSNLPRLSGLALKDVERLDVQAIPNVQWVNVHSRFPAEVARQIGRLPGLRHVTLYDKDVGEAEVLELLLPQPALEELKIDATGLSDESLAAIGRLTSLRRLYLPAGRFSEAGLRLLGALRNLEFLSIGGVRGRGEPLEAVPALPNLKEIRLNNADVEQLRFRGAASLSRIDIRDSRLGTLQLADLQQLRYFRLQDCEVEQLRCSQSPRLGSLENDNCRLGTLELVDLAGLTDVAVRGSRSKDLPQVRRVVLKRLPRLKNARFGDAKARLESVELAELPSLEQLNLPNITDPSRITDLILGELQGFAALRVLSLSGTNVTDSLLEQLAALPEIRYIGARNTAVTQGAVARVRKERPKVSIGH